MMLSLYTWCKTRAPRVLSVPILRPTRPLTLMAPLRLPVVRPLSFSVPMPSPVLPLLAHAPVPVSVAPFLPLVGAVFVPALSHPAVLLVVRAVLLGEAVLSGEGRREEGGVGHAAIRLALGAQLDGALDGFVGLRGRP